MGAFRPCTVQTFPDSFEGSRIETLRRIGNAVPSALAEVLASRLHEPVDPARLRWAQPDAAAAYAK